LPHARDRLAGRGLHSGAGANTACAWRSAQDPRPKAVVGLIARGAARVLIPGVLVGVVLALVVGQLLGALRSE